MNKGYPLKRGNVIAFLNDIYYMLPLQNAKTSPTLYDTN